jgi:excisionase family DNA binding protein
MEVTPAPVLITIDAACARLGICRSVVYRLVNSGDLVSIKIGASRRIPVSAIDDYVARRLAESSAA